MSVINRGAEFLTPKVLKYYPCLTEFLKSLQYIQKKWITPPVTGDNRWEFQPIFYNPNINFKKFKPKNQIHPSLKKKHCLFLMSTFAHVLYINNMNNLNNINNLNNKTLFN